MCLLTVGIPNNNNIHNNLYFIRIHFPNTPRHVSLGRLDEHFFLFSVIRHLARIMSYFGKHFDFNPIRKVNESCRENESHLHTTLYWSRLNWDSKIKYFSLSRKTSSEKVCSKHSVSKEKRPVALKLENGNPDLATCN